MRRSRKATGGQTILIVDDDPRIRRTYARVLVGRGYRVIDAEDGHSGLSVLRRHRVDLVVTDVHMPGMGGLGLLERMRADASLASTRVLVMTATGDRGTRERARELGAEGFVFKPMTLQTLLSTVGRLLAEPAGHDAARRSPQPD